VLNDKLNKAQQTTQHEAALLTMAVIGLRFHSYSLDLLLIVSPPSFLTWLTCGDIL